MLHKLRNTIAGIAISFSSMASATTVDFIFTGAMESFVVPTGVSSIFVETWGAQGWSASRDAGGMGGYTSGDLSVIAGETLYIYVGGQGTAANGNRTPEGGGFNGGGDGQSNFLSTSTARYAGGGGGASDVRQGADTLANRAIVAGGGGGATGNGGAYGGDGGGLVGATGSIGYHWPGGTGGSQTAGGSNGGGFGFGASAVPALIPWNGGGGGGYYGGGTSAAHAGGGGGSSYIGGVTNGIMLQGTNSGDGAVRFTFEAAVVPLPAGGILLITALGGLFVARRKRKPQD